MPLSPDKFLEQEYNKALAKIGSNDIIQSNLSDTDKQSLDILLEYSEKAKGVFTVSLTSIVYKTLHPTQDIRIHQDGMKDGYSGRTFDTKYITPFLKKYKFPAMAESGWLTRSLEQKVPYNLTYQGAISPSILKNAFLLVLDRIENSADSSKYLSYLLQGLIIRRNAQTIELAKPTVLSINAILELLNNHFSASYSADGKSRLPVLALYAAYKCLMSEAKRFNNKTLLPLESHTSADARSGRIGDIDIVDKEQNAFEAVEVKHGIVITLKHVQDAYSKFQTTVVNRYYILSTAPNAEKAEYDKINLEINKIKNVHGCQVIVNGIMPTLKYYLRLLEDSGLFVVQYTELLEKDSALKFEHKQMWNTLVGRM